MGHGVLYVSLWTNQIHSGCRHRKPNFPTVSSTSTALFREQSATKRAMHFAGAVGGPAQGRFTPAYGRPATRYPPQSKHSHPVLLGDLPARVLRNRRTHRALFISHLNVVANELTHRPHSSQRSVRMTNLRSFAWPAGSRRIMNERAFACAYSRRGVLEAVPRGRALLSDGEGYREYKIA